MDGLRALSAFAVVLFHCHHPYFSAGDRGVDVFFVLSGFLITRILLSQEKIDLRAFWSARIRRLVPALLVVAAACLIAAPIFAIGEAVTLRETVYALSYTMNFAMAAGHRSNPLLHTWSLAQEMQFYLLWPLLVPALARAKHPRAILLLVWLLMTSARTVIASFDGHFAYCSPLMHASGLILGALICFCRPSPKLLGLSGMGLIGAGLAIGDSQAAASYGIALTEIGAALLIADIVANASINKRILSAPLLVGVGRISYGIYLWHFPLVMLLDPFPWAKIVVVPLASVLLAWVSDRFIESQFRNRDRRIPAEKFSN
ncbi:MAG TPA: acyltransferase [Rhizomicrobium sp.]|nr:acyltransferase [Rhizomicrobium sp.]